MKKNLQDTITVIILVFFCLVLYFNSFWNAFIFDDLHTIVQNQYIKNLNHLGLFFKGLYSSEPVPQGMLRPLLMLTFVFNYLFSGLNPLGYHIINLLLHFLNGILLYSFLRFLKKDIPFGLILGICLLFIAHSINNEAVIYITCRSDLLVTLFVLSAFFFYGKKSFLLSLCLFILALLTKESALIFPLLILAYDFLRPAASDCTDSKRITQIRYKYIFYIALIGISISYWVYRSIVFGLKPSAIISIPLTSPLRSLWSNFLTQSAVTFFYLRLFFWPYPLTIHQAFPTINSLFNPLGAISVSAIILAVVMVFFLRKRYPLISLGLAWYLICLLPKFYAVLNIVAAEHHFYLPSIGLYLIIAVWLKNLYIKFRKLVIYLFCVVIGVFTILVWFRNYEWRDSFSLWRATIKTHPHSAAAHNNLGIEYVKRGFNIEAENEFKRAISLTDRRDVHLMARQSLAELYLIEGKLASAVEEINKAITINPDYYYIYHLLANVYIKQGKMQEAEKALAKGLATYPSSSDFLIDFGFFYLLQNKLKEAKDYFQKAIRSDPDEYLAYFGLAQVFEKEEDIQSAIKAYRKSISLNPANARAHYNLGNLYIQIKDSTRALKELKQAIILSPNFPEAHNNLAVLYASMDPPQLELARQHAQKAVVLGYKVEEGFLKIIDLPQSQGLHETK